MTYTAPASSTTTSTEIYESISLAYHEEAHYAINVPSGSTNVTATITDVSGDADLYARYGAQPTTSLYDCRPYSVSGRDETCSQDNPTPGTWYVMVRGYSASSCTLTVTYTGPSGISGSQLSNGQSVSVAHYQGETTMFTFYVPSGASNFTAALSNVTNDVDLYTRYGAEPTTSVYDCRPYYASGRSETCSHSGPQAGMWYIMTRGYSSAASSATLTVSYY